MSVVQASSSKKQTKAVANKAVAAAPAQVTAPVVTEATTVKQDVNSSTVEVKQVQKKRGKAVVEAAAPTPVPAVVATASYASVVAGSPAEPVAVAPSVATSSETVVDAPATAPSVEVEEQSEDSFATYDDVHKAILEVDKELLNLHRKRAVLAKAAQKKFSQLFRQNKKRSKGDGKATKRSVSGFNKPAHVPAAFCEYLKLSPSEQLPRTNITALLYKSIKDNKLLNEKDKREVLATPELRNLLRMNEGEHLRFENFQHFVSRVYKADALARQSSTDGNTTDGGSASASGAE